MSDHPRNEPESQESNKRKRRACDVCRRKKIGCDGPQPSGAKCSNCFASSCDCTYTAPEKRANTKSYVATLENRLANMEKLLNKLCPDVDYEQMTALTGPTNPQGSEAPAPLDATSSDEHDMRPATVNEEDTTFADTADAVKQMRLDSDHRSFFGKSSQVMLIKRALDLKKECIGDNPPHLPQGSFKRLEFWTVPSWERPTFAEPEQPPYVFPDPDLMAALFNFYFNETNQHMPLLHRPTFEKSVVNGLHLHDNAFGAVVLLVCAVASRYSTDPRVFMDGADNNRSCGWKWFQQIRIMKKNVLTPPSLYDVQFCCLAVTFLYGSSSPQSTWSLIGIGVRFAQELGAHRRKPDSHVHTVEDELWTRAFWVLVYMDKAVSTSLGRPCAIQEEDYDLEFPKECDDQYWEHPDPQMAFKQPPGRPSVVIAFNCCLRLREIQGYALRTIYSIHQPQKASVGYYQKIVAELESALNEWVDSIPDHLRWDPNREDYLFFRQSTHLQVSYYHLQILIHRPFVANPRKPSTISFPSLAIITNAARSCCRIVDKQSQRGLLPLPPIQLALFTSAIVLLFHIWAGRRSGISVDVNKGMEDIHRCMNILKAFEDRWHFSGRCWDILYDLACVGELPLPQPSPPSHKRERDEDNFPTNASTTPSSSNESIGEPRQFAGSRRVASKYTPIPAQNVQMPLASSLSPPQMISKELGQLPYSQSNLSSTFGGTWEHPNMYAGNTHLTGPLAANEDDTWSGDTIAEAAMDDFFYNQIAAFFPTPFKNMTEDHLAGIFDGSNPQFLTNDNDVAATWTQRPVGSGFDWSLYGY